jgi:outer membrane protein assembly factor BamB
MLAAPLPEAKEAVEPVYLPFGVADAAGKVGCFTLPTGDGLVAVDLATGEVLWETKEANQALVVAGNRLIARTGRDNRVRVVVLDIAAKGKRLLESEPLTLPIWAAVGRPWTYQGQNRRFIAEGRLVEGNLVELNWGAQAGFFGGKFHTPEMAKGQTACGVARVNLETGKVDMLPAAKGMLTPWERPQHPHAIDLQVNPDVNLKKLPVEAQAVAKRNNWWAAYLAGPRAYGLTSQQRRGNDPDKDIVHAVDVKTGKVIWERPVREEPHENPRR